MLVLNFPAFENKKYTAYDRFHGNGPYGKIPTKKEPIRTLGFALPYNKLGYFPWILFVPRSSQFSLSFALEKLFASRHRQCPRTIVYLIIYLVHFASRIPTLFTHFYFIEVYKPYAGYFKLNVSLIFTEICLQGCFEDVRSKMFSSIDFKLLLRTANELLDENWGSRTAFQRLSVCKTRLILKNWRA